MSGEIDSRVVTYRGVKFRVDIDPDTESRPDDYGVPGTDDTAYTDADMEAWRRDEWRYVCVTVSIASTPYDLGLWDSLCSVEWGRLSEVTIGMDDIIRDYLPDLADTGAYRATVKRPSGVGRHGNRGAEMTSHFHYGHAVTGHSPDAEYLSPCLTLRCLADCVRNELSHVVDMLADGAYAHERDGRDLESRIGQSGSADMLEAVIKQEAVISRYRSALDCHRMISDVETLHANLSSQRERAPLYVGQPDLWEAELRRIIFESGNFPLYTDSAETRQFQVWECSESWCDWTHADYPHEPGYLPDCLACQARCHCCGHAGHEDCVHCALVDSGESTCDEASGCEAHS